MYVLVFSKKSPPFTFIPTSTFIDFAPLHVYTNLHGYQRDESIFESFIYLQDSDCKTFEQAYYQKKGYLNGVLDCKSEKSFKCQSLLHGIFFRFMFAYTTYNILFISAKNQSIYTNQYNLKEGRSLVFFITWPHLFFLFKGSEFWISTLPNKICSFDEPILPWKIDFYDNLSNMDRSLM